MLKKTYLSASLALLSIISFIQSNDRVAHNNMVIEHIERAERDVMFEVKTVLALLDKGEKHYKELLQDEYEPTKKSCLNVLNRIIESSEYTTTLEQVIDTQVQLITQEMMHYNDIIIDPSAYPLGQRINDELSLAGFDEDTQQLFNVFYVTVAVLCGSKVLTAKLAAKKQALIAERDKLESVGQAIQS